MSAPAPRTVAIGGSGDVARAAALVGHLLTTGGLGDVAVVTDPPAPGDWTVALSLGGGDAGLFAGQRADRDTVLLLADAAAAEVAQALGGRGARLHKLAPGVCMDRSRWPGLQRDGDAAIALAASTVARILGVEQAAIDRALAGFAA